MIRRDCHGHSVEIPDLRLRDRLYSAVALVALNPRLDTKTESPGTRGVT
jgi:hypothetical protein